MAIKKTNIYVYAHWQGMVEPKLIGTLSAHQGKGRKSFSFEYDKNWIKSEQQFLLDPDIQWFSGQQFPNQKENFGIFLDSMPDTWGRTLMKRRESQNAKESGLTVTNLYEIDYLLGVYDESRMGALRFKLDINGPFLDDNKNTPTPPWSSIRELQQAANLIESDKDNDEIKKWLAILIAPGSSLGGARPKANLLDEHKNLWIAKFPSQNDIIDKAAWEYLAYKLALKAGINMASSKIEKISGKYHTFFTERFDRSKGERIHFASAMTMTGNNEENIRDTTASYLDIAEFIQYNGAEITTDLHQLWRRIIFNIAISNTDDHLRNHGFILTSKGWRLSPAYDINPSTDKNGLALNIDMNNNALDFELAKSVGEYFKLNKEQMNVIIDEVLQSVGEWKTIANKIGISRMEQELMEGAFFDMPK
jgi:serine/threonine-protein kinase HipA